MVVGNFSPQLSNTSVSRATGGHTPTRPIGGRSGLTSNRGTVPGSLISALSSFPGLRNNSSALLNTVSNLASSSGHVDSLRRIVSNLNDSTSGLSISGSSTPSRILADSPSQPETFDYLDAPWASAYQMSKETAYSEALNNTSYQRAVKDMMKAGLNPAVIFGAGNGNTAGVPSFASSARPSSPSRVISSGSSYRRSKSSHGLVSSSAYSVISLLGGIVGAAATGNAGGYWIGSSVAQGAMNALSLLSKASNHR